MSEGRGFHSGDRLSGSALPGGPASRNSTQVPKRAGQVTLFAIPSGSITARSALLSVTSFGGEALRREPLS